MTPEERIRRAINEANQGDASRANVGEARLRAALAAVSPVDLATLSPGQLAEADVSGITADDLARMYPGQKEAAADRARAQGLAPTDMPGDNRTLARLNAVTEGMTAGYGDELAGYAGAVVGGAEGLLEGKDPIASGRKAQDYVLQETRRGLDQLPTGERIGLNIAGGAGLAAFPAGRVAQTASAAGKARKAAKYGMAGGAVAGFGSGQDGFSNRVGEAVVGGIIGGFLGPALYGGGKVLQTGVRKLVGGRRSDLTAGERRAVRAILDGFERDGVTPQAALARLQRWSQDGKPGMLMDMGGDHIRGLAEYAAARPNAYEIARKALRGRAAGAKGRIESTLSDLLGNSGEFAASLKALRDLRSEAANELYERAWQTGVDPEKSDLVAEAVALLNRPSGKQAQARAQKIAEEDGFDFEAMDLMQKLHFYKLGLDDVAYASKRSTSESSAGGVERGAQMRTAAQFRDLLFEMNEDYAIAARKFASDSEVLDAMKDGLAIFKPSMTSDEIAEAIGGMSEAGREAYRLGVAKAIRQRMATSRDGADPLKRFFNSEEWRDRMRPAFENDEAFTTFTRSMYRETEIRRALDETIGNSATARREAGKGVFADNNTPIRDFAEAALNLDAGTAVRNTVRAAGATADERRMNAAAEGVIRALTESDPDAIRQMVNAMLQRQVEQSRRGVSRMPAMVSGGLPVIMGQ